jgi:hypothetical protein
VRRDSNGSTMPLVRRSAGSLIGALALGALAAGCSSNLTESSPSGSGSSFKDRMNALFFGASARPEASGQAGPMPSADLDCPGIDIRTGAATYSVGPPGVADVNPTTLRYQADIAKTARECSVAAGSMTIKVGVQGRIILGPTGGPGQIDVPMRLAVVQEGVEPRTIWTKFYRVPVTVPPGQTSVPFVQIEENMTFPMPKPAELDAYVIYVGFDPTADKSTPSDKKKSHKKPV